MIISLFIIGSYQSGSPKNASVWAVLTRPGEMVLTRMPWDPPSIASWRDMASTPPLAAECARPGSTSYTPLPETDPVLMIEPPPRARRRGHASLQARKTMSNSCWMVALQSSYVKSSIHAK